MNLDLSNKSAFIWFGTALIILTALLLFDGQTLQYLFYLRVPLIGGALLFLLPVICIYGSPSMLGNIFVLKRPWKLAMVMAGAVVVGLGIVLIGVVIGANADERFGLEPCLWLNGLAQPNAISPYILAIILALPTAWASYWASGPNSEEMDDTQRRNGAILGGILSLLFLFSVYWLRSHATIGLASNLLVSLV